MAARQAGSACRTGVAEARHGTGCVIRYCCVMRSDSGLIGRGTDGNGARGDGARGGGTPGTGSAVLVQSVDRAISVLEILARHGPVAVTEIAQELGVHKSTAFRLLVVLERRGLVQQVAERGKYQLGFGIVRLAGATTASLDLTQQSRPVSERLAAEIGETVNVAVLESGYAVNIDQARGPAAVTSHNWVGQRTPLHATSSGKVLLASMPPEARDQILAGPLERYTPHTITDPARLREELAQVAGRGYATTSEELELGLNAVAAPIRIYDGSVAAAISASGPSYRLGVERMPEVARIVIAGAADISARLGYSR